MMATATKNDRAFGRGPRYERAEPRTEAPRHGGRAAMLDTESLAVALGALSEQHLRYAEALAADLSLAGELYSAAIVRKLLAVSREHWEFAQAGMAWWSTLLPGQRSVWLKAAGPGASAADAYRMHLRRRLKAEGQL